MKGPAKWTCFHLYVILVIFSRHAVGWRLAEHEGGDLAEQLIAAGVARQDVQCGTLLSGRASQAALLAPIHEV